MSAELERNVSCVPACGRMTVAAGLWSMAQDNTKASEEPPCTSASLLALNDRGRQRLGGQRSGRAHRDGLEVKRRWEMIGAGRRVSSNLTGAHDETIAEFHVQRHRDRGGSRQQHIPRPIMHTGLTTLASGLLQRFIPELLSLIDVVVAGIPIVISHSLTGITALSLAIGIQPDNFRFKLLHDREFFIGQPFPAFGHIVVENILKRLLLKISARIFLLCSLRPSRDKIGMSHHDRTSRTWVRRLMNIIDQL